MTPPSRRARPTVPPRLHCERLEAREVPAGLDLVAVAPGYGAPIVKVLDASTMTERFQIKAFDGTVRFGVRVAVGDVTGDGVQDIICAAGPNAPPLVRIFSGTDGSLVREFMAYDKKFRGGVFVAVGDTDNDGFADVITGRGGGITPGHQVRVYSGADIADGTTPISVLRSFDTTTPIFRGEIRVAAADVNGDNRADIITALGYTGTSEVRVVSGATGADIHRFDAFAKNFRGGVSIAAGDVDGDGRADIITGTQHFGRTVRVFDGEDASLRGEFKLGLEHNFPNVTVGVTTAGKDGRADIVVTDITGNINIRDGETFAKIDRQDLTRGWQRLNVAFAAVKDGDAVVDANTVALRAIRAASMPPPRASRLLAMVHTAVFDAVNGILGGREAYLDGLPEAPAGASAEAAAAAAAHRILSAELPAQQALFDRYLNAQLAILPNNAARHDGEGYGVTVANAMLAARANDGSTATVTYQSSSEPGHWQPTAPAFADALLPQWPDVTPFTLESGDQFRPQNGPPALNSDQYLAEYEEIKALGGTVSAKRTADQTQIALFWADGAGTVTPPGHWNQIARDLALDRGLSLAETARLFAHLNLALADAAIAAWDAKYGVDDGFGRWRPITAIRNGDTDGIDATVGDPTWTPLITTPPFPAYTSGHSTFSGAAAAVLERYFGANTPFLTYTDALADVARRQESFEAAAHEAGRSRIYGGIHWQSDNVDGLIAGDAIGHHVVDNYLK